MGARVLTVWAALLFLAGPAHASDLAPGDRKSGAPGLLWTREPVRVKPADLALPRLPGKEHIVEFPTQIAVPRTVRVIDSVTFTIGDVQYQVAGLLPVPSRHICVSETGERTACGLRARLKLRNLLAGRLLRCRDHDTADGGAVTIRCVLGRDRLADLLVAAGAAFAAELSDKKLAEMEKLAQAQRKGIWSDRDGHMVRNAAELSDEAR